MDLGAGSLKVLFETLNRGLPTRQGLMQGDTDRGQIPLGSPDVSF